MIGPALDEIMRRGYRQFTLYPDGRIDFDLPEYERLGTPKYLPTPVDIDRLDYWIAGLPSEPIALIIGVDTLLHEVTIYPAY